jgi:adenylate kinase
MTILVLLGGPGAGKGTQARMLAESLGMVHVATGDLFRAAVRDGTPLGQEAHAYMERGELVPDDVTTAMLLERLAAPDAANGAILDGFPRTRAQAEALDAVLAERGGRVVAALSLEVPAERLVERLSSRFICSAAGHVYNIATNPPRVVGLCDEDGSPLIQREDDKPETVRARLAVQLSALADVADHYAGNGILDAIDGDRSIDEVAADLASAARARLASTP